MSTATPGSMTVECPKCGHAYQPTREAIIAGVWRKACPVCYPPAPDDDNREAA